MAGCAGFVAAAASLSAGDGDNDPLVLLGNLAGLVVTIPLLLTVRRVVLGRRPGRLRRALRWTVAVIAMPVLGVPKLLEGLYRYADTLFEPDPRRYAIEPSVLGTVVAALVLAAFLGRRPTAAPPSTAAGGAAHCSADGG
ncbi:hypothetical protein Daura_29090 [Dactylosporangium aurantiacum]|uniref:Uncharacterized protein n=1 Tax=Dactylosporangium aurantiacum TaxID=35754 RepID=A0A9Q9ME00_9ACTN|nr:hypothetical protein [Dactylosporangium aurantiacum]MDG6106710.1 hypothetical protein [Dactylosporangium aurantiacum]UWZ50860.1 hypothetical protein Daura_29090 [Dactylosporangium aurantiacum]